MSQLGFTFEFDTPVTTPEPRRKPSKRATRGPKPRPKPVPGALQKDLFREGNSPVQLAPRLAGQMRVEAVARQIFGPKVLVALTQNRSTMISYSQRGGVLHLRLHEVFADAPEEVLRAVAAFVSGKTTARQSALIDGWIEEHRHLIRAPDQIVPQPYGEVHDLQRMWSDLNKRYFQGTLSAQITWSKALRNRKRHSIRMGSYCEEQNLIRIHPALDQAFVPAYFVQSVVFHEMLHELHGAEEHGSRRAVHTPEFLEDERRYEHFERAKRWERKHLHRLLRY